MPLLVALIWAVLTVALCAATIWLTKQNRALKRTLEEVRSRVLNNLISPAYLSHEVRTPLTVISSASELLADEETSGELNDTQRRFVETIRTNSASTIALAEDYLVLFTLEKSLAPLQLERCALRATMREAVHEFRLMRPSDTRLDNHGAPIYVNADARLLKQAIWNLLTNAVRHGGADVLIDVRVSAQDGIALLQIEDNGVGMQQFPTDSELALVTSEPDSVPVPNAGSGIGMNVVRRIAAAHRGTLLVDSTVGRGTRILMQLPEWGSGVDLTDERQARGGTKANGLSS